jgi:hypothetical protein
LEGEVREEKTDIGCTPPAGITFLFPPWTARGGQPMKDNYPPDSLKEKIDPGASPIKAVINLTPG